MTSPVGKISVSERIGFKFLRSTRGSPEINFLTKRQWTVNKFSNLDPNVDWIRIGIQMKRIASGWALDPRSDTTASMNNSPIDRQILNTKESACAVVQRMLNGNDTRFEMVPFLAYIKNAKLRSQHYKAYFVLCHANTTHSAGWLVCQYTKTGGCPVEKALHSFRTVQSGTSRLERHSATHQTMIKSSDSRGSYR